MGLTPNLELLTREYLVEEYVNKGRTSITIAAEFGIGKRTVLRRLHDYGIPTRPRLVSQGRAEAVAGVLTQEFREREYVGRERSMALIAEETSTSVATISI